MPTSPCPRVAYFCMEFGIDPSFPIYAGGLGILAGDHMKSVGDLHVPLTGIGLFWDEGYTKQTISRAGKVEDGYPKTPRDALRRVDAKIEVTVRGKKVPLRAWRVDRYISSTLYLLEPSVRTIAGSRSACTAAEMRIVSRRRSCSASAVCGCCTPSARRSTLSLQRGPRGVRRARAVAPASLRRRDAAERIAKLRPHVAFTTHTPVPAGNEVHGSR